MGPWLVRNFVRHGVPIFMTITGEHLWRGNNPNATGSSLTRDGVALIETADTEFRKKLQGLDEIGQMRLFMEIGTRYIIEHPGRFAWNVMKRLFYFAWFSPTTGLLYPAFYLLVYRIYYGAMLLAAGLGIFHLGHRLRGDDRAGWIVPAVLVGTWLSVGLIQSIFYVELRHRWGVEGLMLVMSGVGILHVLGPYLASAHWRAARGGLAKL